MMTDAEKVLWDKIDSFKLDDEQSSFTFTARLARENGWSKAYTARVVEEYKKFIFLCCISPSGVTPSDAVDQAWHLHLTYTRSYWIDFCRDTLGQDVHHNPTKGGNAEAEKFDGYYTRSFKLYEDRFGTQPPADIWLDNKKRFSDINFRRVNVSKYQPVRRSFIGKIKFIAVALLFIGLCYLVPYIVQNFEALSIPLMVGGIFLAAGLIVLIAYIYNSNRQNTGNNDGGSSDGCSWDNDSHGHGHSDSHSDGGHGCSSGCSGCSASGCSGCGGGCGGD